MCLNDNLLKLIYIKYIYRDDDARQRRAGGGVDGCRRFNDVRGIDLCVWLDLLSWVEQWDGRFRRQPVTAVDTRSKSRGISARMGNQSGQ